jgi:transcription antitermination factor NusB
VRRRKARELALKMLYQIETNNEDPGLALDRYCESFPYQPDIIDYTRVLLDGIRKQRDMIDRFIETASEHWKMSRIAFVDKNVMRIGIYEMFFSADVPPKVAIDEAIEMGKKYGNEDSGDFINGVLDRILKDYYGQKEPGSK